MRRKLIVTTVFFALIMALVGGATFALFTSSDSNEARTFEAGTVNIDIQRNTGEPVPGPMFYTTLQEGMAANWQTGYSAPKYPTGEWKPGDSHKREMTVKNKGSLPAKLVRIGARISGDAEFLNDTDAVAEFCNKLIVRVESQNGSTIKMCEAPLSSLLAPGGVEAEYKPVLVPKVGDYDPPTQHLNWICSLSSDTGNALQGKKPVVSFYLIAEQAQNNP